MKFHRGMNDLMVKHVMKHFLGVICDLFGALHAGLELFKVIVNHQAVQKTRHKVWNSFNGQKTDFKSFNRANGHSHQIRQILTCLKVKLAVPVGLKCGDVTLNLSFVEQKVL